MEKIDIYLEYNLKHIISYIIIYYYHLTHKYTKRQKYNTSVTILCYNVEWLLRGRDSREYLLYYTGKRF